MIGSRDVAASARRLFRHRDWPLLLVERLGGKVKDSWTRRLNFSGSYEMKGGRKDAKRLLVIVAGYKVHLWELTLARIARFAPEDLDVCVVTPGARSARLLQLAEQNGWSYLVTKANKLALAQNLAIREHPAAAWIYKLDEDIFISEGYFEKLLEGYLRIRESGHYDPGFCAPLINVNGHSYRTLLRMLDLEEEYQAAFEELKCACMGVRAHWDPNAARWLWERSLPFDEVARLLASRPFDYSVVPHRFSIGAILLEREFWESIGGFRTALVEGRLGIEEEDLCCQCMARSRVIGVIHNVFAGHFAFGPQEAGMRSFLGTVRTGTALPDAQPRAVTA